VIKYDDEGNVVLTPVGDAPPIKDRVFKVDKSKGGQPILPETMEGSAFEVFSVVEQALHGIGQALVIHDQHGGHQHMCAKCSEPHDVDDAMAVIIAATVMQLRDLMEAWLSNYNAEECTFLTEWLKQRTLDELADLDKSPMQQSDGGAVN
jgi:hypothetical protein